MDGNIKQDIDFVDYPLWMESAQKSDAKVVTWVDRDGYRFEASRGMPSKLDMLFLYYIMLESQNHNWDQIVRFSRHQILTACEINTGQKERQRLIQSLEAWRRVSISFSGIFYDDTAYEFLEFGIINNWGVREKDNRFEIKLNTKWIEKIRRSEFFKYISFVQIKQLRSPLALRLYEILVKNLYQKTSWEVDVMKLAGEIPMTEHYLAHITPKVEAAVRRIYDKTDLKVMVRLVKQARGQGTFIFTKKEKAPPPGELFSPPEPPPVRIPLELLEMIPEPWRENAVAEAHKILKTSGEGELKECIARVNKAVDKNPEINSYAGYLRQCHNEKWHQQKSPKEIKAETVAIVLGKSELLRRKAEEKRKAEQASLADKHGLVNRMKSEEPERYAEMEKQAMQNLGLNTIRPGRGMGMKIKFEIFRILEL
ncbi:MAG: replication initiator protein A [Desulfamplus sp.]|nr:replication initiator protein A [Desulfamplus sp.]